MQQDPIEDPKLTLQLTTQLALCTRNGFQFDKCFLTFAFEALAHVLVHARVFLSQVGKRAVLLEAESRKVGGALVASCQETVLSDFFVFLLDVLKHCIKSDDVNHVIGHTQVCSCPCKSQIDSL